MSEIEKLYELANIKKQKFEGIASGDYPIAVGYEDYPPFTAEKQIELIKFLLKNYEGVNIDKSFEECLAGAINEIWVDMSEEEKQQVKGILE